MAKKRSLRRYVTNIISFANSRNKNIYRDRSFLYFAGRITPELVKLMVDVWTPIVGPEKDILVIRVVRPKNLRQLGISLTGSTTESPNKTPLQSVSRTKCSNGSQESRGDEEESRAESQIASAPEQSSQEFVPDEPTRHFVHSVLPVGLFSSLDCLKPGDELLQVNGYRLHGSTHVEVVRCLRCLPLHIELVIARSSDNVDLSGNVDDVPAFPASEVDDSATTLHVAASEIGSVVTGVDDSESSWPGLSPLTLPPHSTDLRVSEWIRSSQPDVHSPGLLSNLVKQSNILSTSPTVALSTVSSMNDASPTVSKLLGDSHLGLRPTWSKVPLIVMLQRDKPGFGFSISNYNEILESDVQKLRRSSTTRRSSSLTRPRSVSGDMDHSRGNRYATFTRTSSLSAGTIRRRSNLLVINSIVRGSCVDRDGRIGVGDRLLFVNDRKLSRATLGEAANALHNAPLGYTMIGVAKMTLVPNSPQPFFSSSPQFTALVSNPDESATLHEEFARDHTTDHPLDYYTPLTLDMEEIPYHAAALVVPEMNPSDEKVVRVKTNGLPLGCELDALAAGGVDGCRVVKVLRGGAIEKAAALVPGDYITRINSDNLRRVTNVEAFHILRKASVECTAIEIAYYPGEKVITHRIKHARLKSSSDNVDGTQYLGVNGSGASSSLIEDLPPPDLILTTEPLEQLLVNDPPQLSRWSQTRELKLLKLPGEDTWGLSITGPDVWHNGASSYTFPSLPPEVSQPVFVSNITTNTAAGRCGLLQPGDIIIGVNGMDATCVGCRTVAEWIQAANLVSSSSTSSDDNESFEAAEWAFLYLLVLSLHSSVSSSSSSSDNKPIANIQSIPPVALASDSFAPSFENNRDARPLSFIFNTSTLVRSAFVSSNDSSSMEEPTSVASLEQHGDLPEPLAVSNLAISPPTAPAQTPLQPPPPILPSNGIEDLMRDYHDLSPSPTPTPQTSDALPPPPPSSLPCPPIPSVQTVESQSAWRNIGSSRLAASLAQLTRTYRRPTLVDDEIHVVAIALTSPTSTTGSGGGGGGDSNAGSLTDCETGLGIRLVGHRDTNSRGVFICSLREGSLADRTPGLQVTDEIVQVNNVCVMGLTHVSAKLLITKETEMARRSSGDSGAESKIFLVIRHNVAYNASVMAKPAAGAAPTGCGHFLHHSSLRSTSKEPCRSITKSRRPSKRVEYDFLDVTIERNAQCGLGLCLVNMNPRGDSGVFVQSLLPTSPAASSGQVRCWDRIIAINGETVQEYDAALAKLTACHPSAHLRLARAKLPPGQIAMGKEASSQLISIAVDFPRSFSPHSTPTPIIPGVETTVEIIHSVGDLGFSIIGGSDTHMGSVFIENIQSGGTIHRDGRLSAGDRILAVNDIDLRKATHAEATKTLREAKGCVLLTVFRGDVNVFSLDEIVQTYSVALQKQPGGTFGLVLGDLHSGGAIIADIVSGSPASLAAVLHHGDVILEVDGLDVHKASSRDILALLKQCSNHVLLKTGRLKPPSGQPIPRLKLFTVLLTHPPTPSTNKDPDVSFSASVLRVMGRQAVANPSTDAPSNIFGVLFRPATDGECIYTPGNLIVEAIAPESAASRCGMLQVGDRLLGIDREPVGWLSVDDLQCFSHSFNSLTFEFGRLPPPPPLPTKSGAPEGVSPSSSTHQSIFSSGLGSPRGNEELEVAEIMKPISVVVEDSSIQKVEKSPSSVKHTPMGFKVIDDGDEDDDEEEAYSNVIRQIQVPPPPAGLAEPSLGLTLAAASGACGGQRVVSLESNSPAAVSGFKVGDRIIGLDDRLLLALDVSHDSSSVLQAIEAAWRLRRPPSDLGPLTLTIVRPISLCTRVPSLTTTAPRRHFPTFRNASETTASSMELLAVNQRFRNPPNRRLPRDVGDNLDVQLQAGPPGLLVPTIAAGVTAGVYRGAVNDYLGQPYYTELVPHVPPLEIPSGTAGHLYGDVGGTNGFDEDYGDVDDKDLQPPQAHYVDTYYGGNDFEEGGFCDESEDPTKQSEPPEITDGAYGTPID